MIKRPDLFKSLNRCITENPVTTLLGPRQCGKTTIARTICEPAPVHYYDLENPADRSGLANPLTALGNMKVGLYTVISGTSVARFTVTAR
jgi:predicted AAA+ superfamily ATPase